MSATFLSDLTDVLKNKYQGQINETTNYNTSMLDLFEESDKILMGGADRKSTRLNSSHSQQSRMPSSA